MHDISMPASVILVIAGSLLFYLAAPGQRWLRAPLAPRLCRILSAMFMGAAFWVASGSHGLHPATSVAVVLTVAMACLTACPFIGVMVVRVKSLPESRTPTRTQSQSQSSGAAR